MNEAKYNALSQADRDAIDKLSGEHFAHLAGIGAGQGRRHPGIEAIKAAGINIQTASPAFVAEIKTRIDLSSRPVRRDQAKGAHGAALMKEFRAEIAKAAAGK